MTVKLIDEQWLRRHGVSLPMEDLSLLVEVLQAELELRVGTIIADELSPEQLDAFQATPSDEQIDWLESEYPTYQQIVQKQASIMEIELQQSADMVSLIRSWRQPL